MLFEPHHAVEWTADRVAWLIDDVERFSYSGPGVPQGPLYLIANLAIGGGSATGGGTAGSPGASPPGGDDSGGDCGCRLRAPRHPPRSFGLCGVALCLGIGAARRRLSP